MEVSKEEIFGPVTAITKFKTEEVYQEQLSPQILASLLHIERRVGVKVCIVFYIRWVVLDLVSCGALWCWWRKGWVFTFLLKLNRQVLPAVMLPTNST